MVIVFFLAPLLSSAQDNPLLETKINIMIRDLPLKLALDQISSKSGVLFTYDGKIAESKLRLSIHANGKPLKNVLEEAFKDKDLLFSLLGKEIYIRFDPQKRVRQAYTLSGRVTNKTNGESQIGASISIIGTDKTARSNDYGFYALSMLPGQYMLKAEVIGLQPLSIPVQIEKDTVIAIALEENTLKTVKITAARSLNRQEIGTERLDRADTKYIPMLAGEPDLVKALQLLPGVKTLEEGSGGLFVRGGASDQNMVLLDEAPVYNASHLLGFFSIFNDDAIKSVTLYKSGMPARYGGALSSVLDVRMDEGNNQRLAVSGGLGIISARFKVEGPVVKNRSSFLISARRTYADLLLGLSADSAVRKTRTYFYDINAKFNYVLGAKDQLFVSGYFGRDVFSSVSLYGMDWGNITSTLRWNHIFNARLFSNTSLIYSNYHYTSKNTIGENAVDIFSQIRDLNLKEDFRYYRNDKNTIDFGFNTTFHTLKPGELRVAEGSVIQPVKLKNQYALDYGVYLSNQWKLSRTVDLTYGLRSSTYQLMDGPVYFNLEPRIAASIALDSLSFLKLSYVRNTQNLHLISNSNTSDPRDRWIGSTARIKPEESEQLSLGYDRLLGMGAYEFTAETYYKSLKNQIDYRNGADLFTSTPIENLLLYGKGRAYGFEFLLKKKTGRTTGWASYTWSKTERKIDGINNNQWYNARQDRTHNFTFVVIHQLNANWTFSANWVFATGNAVTFPNVKYNIAGYNYYYYTARNADRMPDYHRLDLGATRILKRTARFSSSLNFSIYNAYLHKNAYTIVFRDRLDDPGYTEAIRTNLFRIVPSVSYNFKF